MHAHICARWLGKSIFAFSSTFHFVIALHAHNSCAWAVCVCNGVRGLHRLSIFLSPLALRWFVPFPINIKGTNRRKRKKKALPCRNVTKCNCKCICTKWLMIFDKLMQCDVIVVELRKVHHGSVTSGLSSTGSKRIIFLGNLHAVKSDDRLKLFIWLANEAIRKSRNWANSDLNFPSGASCSRKLETNKLEWFTSPTDRP